MKYYSFSEIGMLIGTAIGGILAVLAFSYFRNMLFLTVSCIGTTLGIIVGGMMDRRHIGKRD